MRWTAQEYLQLFTMICAGVPAGFPIPTQPGEPDWFGVARRLLPGPVSDAAVNPGGGVAQQSPEASWYFVACYTLMHTATLRIFCTANGIAQCLHVVHFVSIKMVTSTLSEH